MYYFALVSLASSKRMNEWRNPLHWRGFPFSLPHEAELDRTWTYDLSPIKRLLYHWVTSSRWSNRDRTCDGGSKDRCLTAWLYSIYTGDVGIEPTSLDLKSRILNRWTNPPLFQLSASGLEPETNGLKGRCSTIELRARFFASLV